jgi:recombination protein RecT
MNAHVRQQETDNLPAIPLSQMKAELEKMMPEFAKSLPGHVTPEKFVRTSWTAITQTRGIEKLRNVRSLLTACSKAAADGLILDGREAALVIDFRGDVQYRPMMRGLLKLAHQSGDIKSIVVELAHHADEFDYVPTDADAPISHTVDLRKDRGECFAVYALANLRSGGIIFEVMTVPEINKIRDRSDGWKAHQAGKIKSTPWSTDWSEMARKTVFRRLSKYLPSSADKAAFMSAMERLDEDYSFETEAASNGEVGEVRPATKVRGGAAAIMKNITPTETKIPAIAQGTDVPFDTETGEVLEGEKIPQDSTAQQAGDDI